MQQTPAAPLGTLTNVVKRIVAVHHLPKFRREYLRAGLGLFAALTIAANGADVTSTWNVAYDVQAPWSVATNWAPNTDFPNNGNGGFTFDVYIPNGLVLLTDDITIENLLWEGGAIRGAGGLTLNGAFTWPYNGAIEAGSAPLVLRGGGTVTGGYAKSIRGRTVINATNSTWIWALPEGYGFSTGSGAVLDNRGTVEIQSNLGYSGSLGGGTSVILNRSEGIFRQTSSGTVTMAVPFMNEGTVEVLNGTFRLQNGSTNTGTFQTALGTQVYFGDGTNAWNTGAQFMGDGSVLIDGNCLLLMNDASGFSPNNLESYGTIVYNGHAGLQDVLFGGGYWTGVGAVTVNGAFDWPYGGSLNTLDETMTVHGSLTLKGGGTVSGGWNKDMSGCLITNETGSIWNWALQEGWGFRSGYGTRFHNKGEVNIQTNMSYGGFGDGDSIIVNEAQGTLRKSAGAGEMGIAVPLLNRESGLIDVQTGTLALSRSDHFGTVNLEPGTMLWLRDGLHEWNEGAVLTGDGSVIVSGAFGALEVNDASHFSPSFLQSAGTIIWKDEVNVTKLNDLLFEGGTWTGDGAVTIYGTFDWPYGGNIEAGGALSLYGGGTVAASGLPKNIRGRTVSNESESIWNWAGNLNTADGAELQNFGTVNIQADLGYFGDGTTRIRNPSPGVFRKSAGTGTATIGVPFDNDGKVFVASGTLAFNGGFTHGAYDSASITLCNATVSASSDLVIDYGYVRGHGNVNADLTIRESATIAPGFDTAAGTLTINDNLYVAGTLEAHIGGPNANDYDSIKVPAHRLDFAGLSARLKIRMLNGYHPATNQEFVIAEGLFASGATEWFANVTNGNYFPTEDGGAFRVHYGPNSLKGETKIVLTEYKACPEVNTAPEISCGGPIVTLAASAAGAIVSFTNQITVTDDCYPTTFTCTPADGSLFPPGETVVSCTATDPGGLTDSCSFKVTVKHIEMKPSPGGFEMVWAVPGAKLEVSDTVTGPWEEVVGATSPFAVATTEGGKFYRLRFP